MSAGHDSSAAAAVEYREERARRESRAAAASPNGHAESESAEDREIARLAKLTLVDYDRERKLAAERLGVRASILDKLVAAERPNDEARQGQGRKLELFEPEPWPEPVSGPELIGGLEAGISRYVALPNHCAFIAALWVLHTYCFNAFTCTPRLAITSPEKGCGKTTLLDVIFELVPRRLITGSTSAAALFRTIELAKPIILIDEADTFLGEQEELRGVLNQGHRKGGQVLRTVGDDHEPRGFSVHTPVAIAMIGHLPGTLADRSIAIQMRRLATGERVDRFRAGRTLALWELARKCARWIADNSALIEDCEPEIPEAIFNRQADNWEPLLAIAEVASVEVAARARTVALAVCGVREDESLGVRLLADIRDAFDDASKDELPSKILVDALVAMSDRPWGEINHGKPITQNWIARRLKDFAIRPTMTGPKTRRVSGYQKSDFEDAFARYLPKMGSQTSHPHTYNDFNNLDEISSSHRKNGCEVEKEDNTLILNGVCGCEVENPESGDLNEKSAARRAEI